MSDQDMENFSNRLKATFEKIGYPQLNAVTCQMGDDEVVLSGELDSFYLKQVAQSVAVRLAEKIPVRNSIRVR